MDSLSIYLETSDIVNYWVDYLVNNLHQPVEGASDLSRDIRIAEFCDLKFLEQIDNLLRSAQGWGERFFSEYYETLCKTMNVTPDQTSTVRNAVITQLMIASNAELFTAEMLDRDFGYGSTFILPIAINARKEIER